MAVTARLPVLGALLISTVTLSAQQPAQGPPQDTPVFRTSADLVTIDAVVVDDEGKPVTNLTRDDFDVTVAGKHQTLDQAVYVRTQDQPRMLAAARAATAPHGLAGSTASRALKTTGPSPDQVARTIAIVVDDLGLSFRSVFDVRNAIDRYIDTQIEPGDLVAIIRTAGGMGVLQQFTTDKRLLHRAADRLQWDFRSRQGLGAVGAFTAEAGTSDGSGFDTVDDLRNTLASVGSLSALEFISQGLSDLPGRKSIILFSEGFNLIFNDRLTGTERIWKEMARMLSRANAAGVVINTIDARGLTAGALPGGQFPNPNDWRTRDGFRNPTIQTPEGTPTLGSGNGFLDAPGHLMGAADTTTGRRFIGSQESLDFIAGQTGGFAFRDNNDLNLGVTRILDDQQGFYLLGYTAPTGAPRSGWDQNRVKVRVKRHGLHVRARQGFFGPLDMREPAHTPADPLVMSAVSPFGSGGITVRLTSLFGHDATAGPYVRSLLFIDPADLHFDVNATGRHTARLQVLLMAIGDNGQVVDGWRREVPLALTDENFHRITERGIVVTVRSSVKTPGPYQLRAAVEDLTSKAVGSASQFLEVPDVGRGQLALSGVLLKGTTGDSTTIQGESNPGVPAGLADPVLFEPEVRVLSPGTQATYAYEIYDGLKDDNPDLQMATAVIRDGKVVYQSPFTPVTATPRAGDKVRTIPIAGTLTLGRDMPAGPYTLEVIVRRQHGKKLVDRKQWLNFEIR
jgi:VWFA-related protein